MNQYKTSRSTNDALSLPALKGGVSRAKAMKIVEEYELNQDIEYHNLDE